jgi:hypothetical protein
MRLFQVIGCKVPGAGYQFPVPAVCILYLYLLAAVFGFGLAALGFRLSSYSLICAFSGENFK